ncbi:ATP synthase I [Syntrophobotulus glycolicus DSM 8271]|uniref:ATP synthase I n=1 Tax=Syntrophobotulus glycolicus (strain DSM 8271 / FlGlyR) TaxID=645991 RepID=F0T2B3_SYNGF|nr:ATP synthase I [Syntrophobotulus glycolicus DSM 8271]
MSRRIAVILSSIVTSGVCFGILFTKYDPLIGFLIGFLTGMLNVQMLFRFTRKVMDKTMESALRAYMINLFSRLGFVSMVVAVVARFRQDWLLMLAGGIAVGVIIPLVLSIKNKNERG